MSRVRFLLDIGILSATDPRITREAIRPSKTFLNKFAISFDRLQDVDAAIRKSYMQILKVNENNSEDIQIIKNAVKTLF